MNKLSKLILMLPLALAPLAGQAAPKGGSHAALAAGFERSIPNDAIVR